MSNTTEQIQKDTNEDFDSGYFYNCDKTEVHELHIKNPSQYDKNGSFIKGSGVNCLICGVEWEDDFAVAMCPCRDEY